jgi:hypothetical protein
LPQTDEVPPLLFIEMAKSGQRIANSKRRDIARVPSVEIQRDQASHRKADEMSPLGAKELQHAAQIAREVTEINRTLIIVTRAVAARVPRNCVEMLTEFRELIVPVGTISADSVKADHQRSVTALIDCDSRRSWYVVSGQSHRLLHCTNGAKITSNACRRLFLPVDIDKPVGASVQRALLADH